MNILQFLNEPVDIENHNLGSRQVDDFASNRPIQSGTQLSQGRRGYRKLLADGAPDQTGENVGRGDDLIFSSWIE